MRIFGKGRKLRLLVIELYSLFLHRSPESEEVIAQKILASDGQITRLISSFLESDEFKVAFLNHLDARHLGSKSLQKERIGDSELFTNRNEQKMISYSQNFEDVILWRVLKDVEPGHFIDIGAQDPIEDSVSYWFYLNGWTGANVEPIRKFYEKLVLVRPRDCNYNFALTSTSGMKNIYEIEGTGLSTLKIDFAQSAEASGHKVVQRMISSLSVQEFQKLILWDEVHFMKIDVEGSEFDILSSFDFHHVRPWIVIVESMIPNSQKEIHFEWEGFLTSNRYQHVYSDGLNRFYLSMEKIHLKKHFRYPPNVFDNFTRKT